MERRPGVRRTISCSARSRNGFITISPASRPAGPGFKKIIINPQPVGDLTWVKASYDSIRGKIVSDWKRDGGKFTLNVTIPPNTTATVLVPAKSAEAVTESRVTAGGLRTKE